MVNKWLSRVDLLEVPNKTICIHSAQVHSASFRQVIADAKPISVKAKKKKADECKKKTKKPLNPLRNTVKIEKKQSQNAS